MFSFSCQSQTLINFLTTLCEVVFFPLNLYDRYERNQRLAMGCINMFNRYGNEMQEEGMDGLGEEREKYNTKSL